MRRRLKSAVFVIVSQLLLIALAITWLIQMFIIAANHSIYIIEDNKLILYSEISVSLIIIVYAIYVLVTQLRRLNERRQNDRRAPD
jgi:ABC-type nickel/cobalt efflux system permease component RcnA